MLFRYFFYSLTSLHVSILTASPVTFFLLKIIVPSALNVSKKVNSNSGVLLLTWTVSYYNVMPKLSTIGM